MMIKKYSPYIFSLFVLCLLIFSGNSILAGEPIRSYYPDGQLKSMEPTFNGQRHGIGLYYHQNGVKYGEIPWENGKKNGQYRLYRSDGSLDQEHSYKQGLKHGWFRWYSAQGSLTAKAYYENDIVAAPQKIYAGVPEPLQKIIVWFSAPGRQKSLSILMTLILSIIIILGAIVYRQHEDELEELIPKSKRNL